MLVALDPCEPKVSAEEPTAPAPESVNDPLPISVAPL
jgi:hypothetical protein